MRISFTVRERSLLQDYIQDLWACARIEVKDPLESGLPSIESLPNVEMQQPM